MAVPDKRSEASDEEEEENQSAGASDEGSEFSDNSDDESDIILSAQHGAPGAHDPPSTLLPFPSGLQPFTLPFKRPLGVLQMRSKKLQRVLRQATRI